MNLGKNQTDAQFLPRPTSTPQGFSIEFSSEGGKLRECESRRMTKRAIWIRAKGYSFLSYTGTGCWDFHGKRRVLSSEEGGQDAPGDKEMMHRE